LKTVVLRGNVDTRLAKVATGEVDATILAAAGLDRLGRVDVGVPLDLDVMLPAPAQGVVGIEIRADDLGALSCFRAVNHVPTYSCLLLERTFLGALAAGCHSPVSALAVIEGDEVTLRAELLAEDGSACVAGTIAGDVGALELANVLAKDLLARAPESVRRLFAV
jgi:hydroxymethylbilane synthase